jgi:hypothetical protein
MEQIRNDILIDAYLKAMDLELDSEFLELLYQELTTRHLHELVPSPPKNMIKIS